MRVRKPLIPVIWVALAVPSVGGIAYALHTSGTYHDTPNALDTASRSADPTHGGPPQPIPEPSSAALLQPGQSPGLEGQPQSALGSDFASLTPGVDGGATGSTPPSGAGTTPSTGRPSKGTPSPVPVPTATSPSPDPTTPPPPSDSSPPPPPPDPTPTDPTPTEPTPTDSSPPPDDGPLGGIGAGLAQLLGS
jgi:hypothetical protein